MPPLGSDTMHYVQAAAYYHSTFFEIATFTPHKSYNVEKGEDDHVSLCKNDDFRDCEVNFKLEQKQNYDHTHHTLDDWRNNSHNHMNH